jgi:UDP-N-acetylglucosamine--N-acetylmuramyl-(pentapeptide) pyrophosphoryl-undecaprenol N-acetylglucosamine transferase
LEAGGAAVVAEDPATLTSALGALARDPARRAAMSAAARGLARPDAARRIAGLVERLGAAA